MMIRVTTPPTDMKLNHMNLKQHSAALLILTQRNSQTHGQEKTKLCFIKYCSLNLCGAMDLHLLAASCPSYFTPSKEPWYKSDRKKMGYRTGLNIVSLKKISALPGSELQSSSSIAL